MNDPFDLTPRRRRERLVLWLARLLWPDLLRIHRSHQAAHRRMEWWRARYREGRSDLPSCVGSRVADKFALEREGRDSP